MATLVIVIATLTLIISGYNLFKTYTALKSKKRNTTVVLGQIVKPIKLEANFKAINYQINQVLKSLDTKTSKGEF